MITNQLKENIIQGCLLYVIRSFLQVGFRFQYQLINLVWHSIDFFSFSWSQYRPQSNFKKLKTSFLHSSYNEKMCWGQDWAEASLSTISWFYILVCAVVQKYKKIFFEKTFLLVLILPSICFICITWKRKLNIEQQPHRACQWTKSNKNNNNKKSRHIKLTTRSIFRFSLQTMHRYH